MKSLTKIDQNHQAYSFMQSWGEKAHEPLLAADGAPGGTTPRVQCKTGYVHRERRLDVVRAAL